MEYVNLSIMPRKLFVLMAMAAGCSLTPIDAMALDAVQITQQANSIKGRILDSAGEPIIGATVSGLLGFIGFAACLYFLAYQKTYLWNKNVWPELYNQWEHSWVCLKCGHKFIM